MMDSSILVNNPEYDHQNSTAHGEYGAMNFLSDDEGIGQQENANRPNCLLFHSNPPGATDERIVTLYFHERAKICRKSLEKCKKSPQHGRLLR
ncbi:hypothetical protein D3C78_1487680 [compost metagenome]